MMAFWFGVLGSVGVEAFDLCRYYGRGRALPARYSHPGYWAARTCLALMGGVLAYAQHVQTEILALQIGMTTPALIDAMGHKIARDDEARD
jgi:hypothetical protein